MAFRIQTVVPIEDWRHWSANTIWVPGAGGQRIRLTTEARAVRARITRAVRRELSAGSGTAVDAPVMIGIHVSKPSHRCDAVNVVKQVCDAVRDALAVDDNWYGLSGLTWDVRPPEPVCALVIEQTAAEPMRVCSECGDIVPNHAIAKGSRCQGCART